MRKRFASARPLHVTLRMDRSVRRLRNRRMYGVLYKVFCLTCDQGRFRMVHYSVQDNHLHLVVEASDRAAMTSGMRRIGIRVAKQLNKAMGRLRGRVLGDRYDEQHLESPKQVRNALGYVLCNFRKHYWKEKQRRCERGWMDPFSSAEVFDGWKGREGASPARGGPVVSARTWLLTTGWRRGGLIVCDYVPGAVAV
jgi:REP element-mobilizing transposase RayT